MTPTKDSRVPADKVSEKLIKAHLYESVEEIKPLFHQCKRCGTWVCGEVCWNAE